MGGRALAAAAGVYGVAFLLFLASGESRCIPSSCGVIRNISSPFRLEGDPKRCGRPDYELSCDYQNRTVLYLYGAKYYVSNIDYDSTAIRVVDAGVQQDNCSTLPLTSVTIDSYSYRVPYIVSYELRVTFLSCENPVNSTGYVETAPCRAPVNSKRYSYVLLSSSMTDSESAVADSCSVDLLAWSSSSSLESCYQNNTCSYSQIHNALAYGLRLLWGPILMQEAVCVAKKCGHYIYCGNRRRGFALVCRCIWEQFKWGVGYFRPSIIRYAVGKIYQSCHYTSSFLMH